MRVDATTGGCVWCVLVAQAAAGVLVLSVTSSAGVCLLPLLSFVSIQRSAWVLCVVTLGPGLTCAFLDLQQQALLTWLLH
jgi:hypothetical protein